MNKLFIYTKLCAVFYLIFAVTNCGFLPKSECELSESDGKNILGVNVVAIDKNNPVFGDSGAAKDKNLRACGYVPKEPSERGNLYWMQTKSEDAREAERLYGIITEKLADAGNYSVEAIPDLGEEAKLSRFEDEDSKKVEIAVRKGKDVILITISKPSEREIPVEEVKSLARRIAGKITD